LLQQTIDLEVTEVFKIEAVIFAIELCGALFTTLDYGFDVTIDKHAGDEDLSGIGETCGISTYSSEALIIFSTPCIILARS
jgi:hypothetical protein